MSGLWLPLDCLANLTNLGIDDLAKVSLPIEKADSDYRDLAISKTFECISSEDPKTAAVSLFSILDRSSQHPYGHHELP